MSDFLETWFMFLSIVLILSVISLIGLYCEALFILFIIVIVNANIRILLNCIIELCQNLPIGTIETHFAIPCNSKDICNSAKALLIRLHYTYIRVIYFFIYFFLEVFHFRFSFLFPF